jgi:N-methylhydantoinase A
VKELLAAFEAEHVATYGHSAGDEEVDIVNLRVAVALGGQGNELSLAKEGSRGMLERSGAEREAYFGAPFGLLSTPVTDRAGVPAEAVRGPLIVEEYDFTCVVPPDFTAASDELGSIVLTRVEEEGT